jgi:phage shock protein PspC (stress-responsive transcriptional regulator)
MKPTQDVGRGPCGESLESLRSFLDGGTPPAPGHVAHWRECADCRRVVSVARREIAELEDEQDASSAESSLDESARAATTAAVEAGRAAQRGFGRWRAALILAVGTSAGAVGTRLMGAPGSESGAGPWTGASLAWLLLGLSMAAAGLALLRVPSRLALYKRLRPGYQLSGVCLGLAEKTGAPVGALRLLFFVLALANGVGIWIYVVLDLLMPVHPEDRRHLLRFRILRWWRRTRRGAEGTSAA